MKEKTKEEIILKHLQSGMVHKEAIKTYLDTGSVTGGLKVRIMKAMEEYAESVIEQIKSLNMAELTNQLYTEEEVRQLFCYALGVGTQSPNFDGTKENLLKAIKDGKKVFGINK